MTTADGEILSSTIMIVDDNPANVFLLQGMLMQDGYANTIPIMDPREVMPKFRAQGVDLVLLDIRMPYLDGFQVLELLRGEVGEDYLPVIVLTAQTDQETRQRALAGGAKDFLNKPFQDWEVLLRIRNTLETRKYYKGQKIRADVMEDKVRERTAQLGALQDAAMVALGSLAETRDSELGNHIRRTQKYIRLLADHLRDHPRFSAALTPEYIEMLQKSAPLHDVGKIGIPDHILLKPGRLTAEEFEVMKQHAAIGRNALRSAEEQLKTAGMDSFLRVAGEIAGSHHEKWDGTGYPDGLAGDDIPVCARLMSIADFYDALTTRRPYKEPVSHADTMAMVVKGRGTHFDPDVVDAFLVMNEQFDEIARSLRDDHG